MAFEGMDPDQIESLGRRLQGEANSLHSIMQQLDGLVNNMSQNWLGADSTRFQASYQQQYRTQLVHASEQLANLGSVALRNAGEQRAASH